MDAAAGSNDCSSPRASPSANAMVPPATICAPLCIIRSVGWGQSRAWVEPYAHETIATPIITSANGSALDCRVALARTSRPRVPSAMPAMRRGPMGIPVRLRLNSAMMIGVTAVKSATTPESTWRSTVTISALLNTMRQVPTPAAPSHSRRVGNRDLRAMPQAISATPATKNRAPASMNGGNVSPAILMPR